MNKVNWYMEVEAGMLTQQEGEGMSKHCIDPVSAQEIECHSISTDSFCMVEETGKNCPLSAQQAQHVPIDNGGPAFPRIPTTEIKLEKLNNDCVFYPGQEGMTLRDYFAGQVLSNIIIYDISDEDQPAWRDIAEEAYKAADAMLEKRT